MIEKKMPWNLTKEGKENIVDCLEKKFANAQVDLDNKRSTSLRKNTIINIDEYELIILMWALDEYKRSRKNYAKSRGTRKK